MDNKTYNVGDAVTEMGGMTLVADFVKVVVKNDGTATSTNPDGTASGVWMETKDGIEFMSDSMNAYIEFDGTYLKVPVSYNMTVVLVKE